MAVLLERHGAVRTHEAARLGAADPVFLVGCERSGTTLLRLMLDGHPSLAFHGESEYFTLRMPEVGWPEMRAYREWLSTYRGFVMSGFKIDPTLEYTALIRSFLEQKRARDCKPMVGATVHKHFDRLVRIWPRARFIHLVRDGRDVARSVVELGWAGNAWGGVALWLEAERQWDRLRVGLPADRRLEVRYEDLVSDARATLSRICEFLGVALEESMFDYARTTTYDLPNPAFVAQWRRRLSERDIREVEARAGDMLRARAYKPSGLPALELDKRDVRRLARADRAGRFRFRWNRYGAALCLADMAVRRVGPGWLRAVVRRRMNEVEMRHLK